MDIRFDRAWVKINLDHIAHNLQMVKRFAGSETKVLAVIKADAYGHGAVEVAKTLIGNGADRLAVACLDEAVQLRKSNIDTAIHVLSHTFPHRAKEIIDFEITQTIFDMELAMELSRVSIIMGKRARLHIKVDTGMGRLGFPCTADSRDKICRISALPGIDLEGIMTHFSSADEEDPSYTLGQFDKFKAFCCGLQETGLPPLLKHAANSAAIMKYPQIHLDMVRPGLMLYGLYPSRDLKEKHNCLLPAMSFKANIINVNIFEKDSCISYGRTFKTGGRTTVATVPAGYADGYSRGLSNNGCVLVKGRFAPVIGRVCMDHTVIDLTGMDAEVGEEAVLFGKSGLNEISADEIAEKLGTINYEVVCKIGSRVPRVYYEKGRLKGVCKNTEVYPCMI